MARQPQAADRRQLVALQAQDSDIAFAIAGDIEETAVRAEGEAFGAADNERVADLLHFLAFDAQERDGRMLVMIERRLRRVGAVEQQRDGVTADWTDGKAFGPVADRDLIDDAWRIERQVDHRKGI